MTSVVIPTCGTLDERGIPLLAGALHAVADAREVVVVTTDGRITPGARALLHMTDATVVDVPGPFNFSHAINAGAAVCSGDDLLLLNDDIAACSRSQGWLEHMTAARGGIVGALLLSPDEHKIEHAGVKFDAAGGMPAHYLHGHSAHTRLLASIGMLAVTGAAMLVRRQTFDKLGGLCEQFPVNYGDIDFCLRALKLGVRIVQCNRAVLIHRESSTRGKSIPPTPQDAKLLADRHAALLRSHGVTMDPFHYARRRTVVA